VFTDGASRGNPGPGGWGAVIVCGDSSRRGSKQTRDDLEVVEIGGRVEHTTNNRMELTAAIEALKTLQSPIFDFSASVKTAADRQPPVFVYTDSSYLVNGITKWIHGWRKSGWRTTAKTEVENRDLWETLAELAKGKIEWRLVPGHAGVAGNARCDEIAASYADWTPDEPGSWAGPIKLYRGPLQKYPLTDLLDLKITDTGKKDAGRKKRRQAYSYVSLVNGVIQIHKSWEECERRVKGVGGAKYKKAMSFEEEAAIIDSFGRLKP